MDRCRCKDFEEAVKKLKIYTVGTLRPDIIEKYDSSPYIVAWVYNKLGPVNLNVKLPRVWKRYPAGEEPKDPLSPKIRKKEQMWCQYISSKKK